MNILETTCFLLDRQLLELDVKQESVPVECVIVVSQIEAVRQCFDESGNISETNCIIYFKSGETLEIGTSFNTIKDLLLNK